MNQDEEKRISPEREKLEKEVAAHPFLIGIERSAYSIAGRLCDAFPFSCRRHHLPRR